MTTPLKFTVDSRLLEELGRRLVGAPELALAELVKNSYDADAYHVHIDFDPEYVHKITGPDHGKNGRIIVADSGHGMTYDQFRDYWMRIGHQEKRAQGKSTYLQRQLTGSKGVGRLSAQYLSDVLLVETISVEDPGRKLVARVDWGAATQVHDLVEVSVPVDFEPAGPDDFPGTKLTLLGLKQSWNERSTGDVAREIWMLEPPRRKLKGQRLLKPLAKPEIPPLLKSDRGEKRSPDDFRIIFTSPWPDALQKFDEIQSKILDLYDAKIEGSIINGIPRATLTFYGDDALEVPLAHLAAKTSNDLVEDARFEVFVFDPQGRQKGRIPVDELRSYLKAHGGVPVFDNQFRLAFYAKEENDWLRITADHAMRTTGSSLIPAKVRESMEGSLLDMPRIQQLLGEVHINSTAEPSLQVSITRDRLVASPALDRLRDSVRTCIHFYSYMRGSRKIARPQPRSATPSRRVGEVGKVLSKYEDQIPEAVATEITKAVAKARQAVREEEITVMEQMAMLSSFATAGLSLAAYHHEVRHQLKELERLMTQLERDSKVSDSGIQGLLVSVRSAIERIEALGGLVTPLFEQETMTEVSRYRIHPLVQHTVENLSFALDGIEIEIEGPEGVRFPAATYVEWVSILQNVLLNAANALIGVDSPQVRIEIRADGKQARLSIMDNGSGIDVAQAERYFEPLVRGIHITQEAKSHGLAGSGLGLAIVRLIATRRGAEVTFVHPPSGWKTAFELRWNT